MRHKIIAGNWKMHMNAEQTEDLLNDLIDQMPDAVNAQVIVAPPFVNLAHAVQHLQYTNIGVAAQNMHQAPSGAFTGEISGDMLRSIGVEYAILGHSERRAYFHETDEALAEKVKAALQNQIVPIFCIGEELKQREAGEHFQVIADQLRKGLFHLQAAEWANIIIAYEPVWAIGTGVTASPEQAQEVHAFIREEIRKVYKDEVADQVAILYGGSMKPDNAKELLSQPDVDGGLIGGASLKAADFVAIIKQA